MRNNNEYAFIATDTNITIVHPIDGVVTTSSSNPVFDKIKLALKEGHLADAFTMCNKANMIQKYWSNKGVQIADETVYVDGNEVNNVITRRMVSMLEDGYKDITPIKKFLENILLNPSRTAVNELYLFLEHNDLALTPDGCFLAYKRVNADYTDIYSGQFDNSVGLVVSMPRNEVDDERDRTCSSGLHFCSQEYLCHYGSSSRGHRTVVVKINPKDVVSIPSDYNNAKGRTCAYEVVGEHTKGDKVSHFDTTIFDSYPF